MTETLLSDLETIPRDLEAQVGESERIHQHFVDLVRNLVRMVEGSARLFQDAWQQCVREVAKGKSSEIQALRDRLIAAFTRRLTLIRDAHRLARMADETGLQHELADMERLRERVFDRWQTSEDLEDLAVRDFPLSQPRLQELARQYPAPQSWYDEEGKPF